MLIGALIPVTGLAQKPLIAPEHHPWGSLKPGAWRKDRLTQETLDEKGQVAAISIIETRITLVKVEADGVTLERERCVDLGGKQIEAEVDAVKQGFHRQPISPNLQRKEIGAEAVVIEGRKIPCKVIRLELNGPTGRTTTDIYYSAAVAPYVLKQKIVTTDPGGETKLSETTITVVRLDMPSWVHTGIKNSMDVETVHKHPKGTIRIWSVTSPEIPGGIISYRSKELDQEGRLVRRSTLELLDYDLQPEQRERTGLLRRRIWTRKSSERYSPR
jgi:hypothetical protein